MKASLIDNHLFLIFRQPSTSLSLNLLYYKVFILHISLVFIKRITKRLLNPLIQFVNLLFNIFYTISIKQLSTQQYFFTNKHSEAINYVNFYIVYQSKLTREKVMFAYICIITCSLIQEIAYRLKSERLEVQYKLTWSQLTCLYSF